MRSNNLTYLLLLFSFTLLLHGCQTVSTGENVNAAERAKTEAPFPNKEPEKYQTEIWQTSARGVEKFFMARDGAKWRLDSAFGAADQVTTLHTDKDYVLAAASKTYAEYPATHGFDERENMVSEISLGMLNGTERAIFEKLGTEAGITKYKMTADAGSTIETFIYFDEKLGIPVKKEIFKVDGGQRVLDRSVELSGFKTEVEAATFTLPKDYQKSSIEEMKKVLTGAK